MPFPANIWKEESVQGRKLFVEMSYLVSNELKEILLRKIIISTDIPPITQFSYTTVLYLTFENEVYGLNVW